MNSYENFIFDTNQAQMYSALQTIYVLCTPKKT
jgi:hypothetical protein